MFIANLHNFWKRNELFSLLCRRCSKIYESQTQLEDHISRCIEQESCKKTNLNPNKKTHWLLKINQRNHGEMYWIISRWYYSKIIRKVKVWKNRMFKILGKFQVCECWFERKIHYINIIPDSNCKWKGKWAFFLKKNCLPIGKISNHWSLLWTIGSKNKRVRFNFKTIMPWLWRNNKNRNYTWKSICNLWKRTKHVFFLKRKTILNRCFSELHKFEKICKWY